MAFSAAHPPRNPCHVLSHVSLFFFSFLLLHLAYANTAWAAEQLFSYNEESQEDSALDFPQWLSVLERHIKQDRSDGDALDGEITCQNLQEWHTFLEAIKDRPPLEQLREVNAFANKKKYILDSVNYGVEEYWAIVKEFLLNNGDCEDYAITKFFSLRWLGFQNSELRIVVLQDTNLRIPHAVLAVYFNNDILILDNQLSRIVSHRQIVHYVPIYSINEKHWWLHLPPL
jgi:predicted transglutaminase-like cysteine proteinase